MRGAGGKLSKSMLVLWAKVSYVLTIISHFYVAKIGHNLPMFSIIFQLFETSFVANGYEKFNIVPMLFNVHLPPLQNIVFWPKCSCPKFSLLWLNYVGLDLPCPGQFGLQ